MMNKRSQFYPWDGRCRTERYWSLWPKEMYASICIVLYILSWQFFSRTLIEKIYGKVEN